MPRRRREDEPGAWHHVMNRGIAKGPMFSSAREARFFLAQLAREVRRGELEVVAYSVMTTHFHALVVSRHGRLGAALRRIEAPYVRRFNRRHERDGGLVRGRYLSKRVRSDAYRETLIAYIDRNAAEGGLVAHGAMHPFGSAFHYARSRGPIWLSRGWVEARVRAAMGARTEPGEAYVRHFSTAVPEGRIRWMEEQLRRGALDEPMVDRFLRNIPERVIRYLRARARLADGRDRTSILVDATTLDAVLGGDEVRATFVIPGPPGIRRDPWDAACVGLLHDLAGLGFREIAVRGARSPASAHRAYDTHRTLLRSCDAYVRAVEAAGAAVVQTCHGAGSRRHGSRSAGVRSAAG